MTKNDVADLIERFLLNKLSYPQEWNDFVDTSQSDIEVDGYRRMCYKLDPLINYDGPKDKTSLDELRKIVGTLRN